MAGEARLPPETVVDDAVLDGPLGPQPHHEPAPRAGLSLGLYGRKVAQQVHRISAMALVCSSEKRRLATNAN